MAKHAVKVHVWARISMRGATKICIFDQIIDAPYYVNTLEYILTHFIQEKFSQRLRFMQDHGPKHTRQLAWRNKA